MAGDPNNISDLVQGDIAPQQQQGIEDLVSTTRSATLGEKAGAAGEGFAGGALETVGVIPGAIGGATLGAAVGGPPGAVVGGLAGAGYGMWAGHTAREGLGLKTPQEMAPEVRKYGVLGESFGGGVAALGTPYGAVAAGYRLTESVAGKLINSMIDSAKMAPLKFGLVETAKAGSAAYGAMSAESLFPGKVGARMTAEVVGGALNPAALVRAGASHAIGFGNSVLASISEGGRQTAAAKLIADVAAKTGENLDGVYAAYKAAGVIDSANLTPAQKTGSMALGALEDYLANFSGKFDLESQNKAREGLDVLRAHINLLTQTGDPAALKAAAEARSVYYRTLIQGRTDGAMAEAQAAVGKITKDTPEMRAVLSTKVRSILDQSIVDARKAESELWNKWTAAEGGKPSGFENLQRQFADEYANVLPEYRPKRVPGEVQKFLDRVSKTSDGGFNYDSSTFTVTQAAGKEPGSTVGEMYQLRSELLNEARQLSNAGDYSSARSMNNLAEAVLDDLDGALKTTGKAMYDEARAFTKEFHDSFSRSFVGKAEATGKYGDRIAPELTLRKALASGGEAGALQMGEIENATRFMLTRGLQDPGAVETVLDAQNRFIRLAASEAIDTTTGVLNVKKLQTFMNNNAQLMNRFPGIKSDLTAALTSTNAAKRIESIGKGQSKLVEEQKVFGKIVNGEPINIVQKAMLNHFDMNNEMGKIISMVTKGTVGKDGKPVIASQEAVNGLRSSIYAAAISASTGRNRGEIDLNQVRALLFTNPPNQKSVVQLMEEGGIISNREVGKVKQLFGALDSIQRSQRVATAVEVKEDFTDAATTLFARMLGSNIAVTASRATGSKNPSLIVAGAGARFAEYIMKKMSITTAKQMLVDAISDPSSGKLDIILKQASTMTPKQQLDQITQMNAWAISVGTDIIKQSAQQTVQPWTGN